VDYNEFKYLMKSKLSGEFLKIETRIN
jgi:hypothetical protein